MNSGSNRNGRQILNKLQEATQSHHLHKSNHYQKSDSRNSALILFEDIDVVFKDFDDGFYNAVNILICSSKRPIVLTSSNPNFLIRKSLKIEPKLFRFKMVPESISGQFLRLMCLSEGFPVDLESVKEILRANSGNISR